MKNVRFSPLMVIAMLLISTPFCQAATDTANNSLLCAITEVIECDALGECTKMTANDVGLPDFLLIDLQAKKIKEATAISLRETSFTSNNNVAGLTILSGVDGLRGWSAVLSDSNTRLTASVSDELVAFVVFGVCRKEQ